MQQKFSLAVSFCLLLAFSINADEFRTWTSASGKHTTEAKFVGLSDDETSVILRRTDGKEAIVPLDKLSKEDLEYIAQRKETINQDKEKPKPTVSNEQFSDADQAKIDKFCAKYGRDVKAVIGNWHHTLLHKAIQDNEDASVVRFLVSEGADVNVKDSNGWSPLNMAIQNKVDADVFRILVTEGAQIEDVMLHRVVANGNVELVELLVSNGADVNAKILGTDSVLSNDSTPLHWAAWKGNVEMTKFLISKGADVNAKTSGGRTPLDYANEWLNTEVAEYLTSIDAPHTTDQEKIDAFCAKHGRDVKAVDERGCTLLHKAAQMGNLAVVKYLVARGANVKAEQKQVQRRPFNATPLHFAAAPSGNLEIVKFLVSKGANVNAKDSNGITPLHYVESDVEIAEFLISKGANVNAKNNNGGTPLYVPAATGNVEYVEFLISKGANVNTKTNADRGLWTPLHTAALNGQVETVKILVSKKADVNAKTTDGKTPLDLAKDGGYTAVVDYLSGIAKQ